MQEAKVPHIIAKNPYRVNVFRWSGANTPIPPICIPMELMLAKPHNANVAIIIDFS